MTDIMRLLYDFALDARIGQYLETEAHAAAGRSSSRREEELRAALSPQQRGLFTVYQEAESYCRLLELEAMFQAACALVGELPG